ncbi:helix-turn-helix transcriptional regulator [Candidatus Bathyarchaeota archaeon]|nr:helix-turn-helix transcriptional regulator [Candidatus Bathyarchaeota archaeon]
MSGKIIRRFFLGFIYIHILHHAKDKPFYGAWMIEELKNHGYQTSAGTLYPILHSLQKEGLIKPEEKVVEGKVRKYYSTTPKGEEVLEEARNRAFELFKEIKE